MDVDAADEPAVDDEPAVLLDASAFGQRCTRGGGETPFFPILLNRGVG